jgi:hypothetical protein
MSSVGVHNICILHCLARSSRVQSSGSSEGRVESNLPAVLTCLRWYSATNVVSFWAAAAGGPCYWLHHQRYLPLFLFFPPLPLASRLDSVIVHSRVCHRDCCSSWVLPWRLRDFNGRNSVCTLYCVTPRSNHCEVEVDEKTVSL